MANYRVIKGLEEHPVFNSSLASNDESEIFNLKHFPATDFYRRACPISAN